MIPTKSDPNKVSAVRDYLQPQLQALSLPIWLYAEDHKTIRPIGTGSLLADGDRLYLVTAHHVLEGRHTNDVLSVSRGVGSSDVIPIPGIARSFPEWDLSVIEVAREAHSALRPLPRCGFERVGELEDGGFHLIVGWPVELRLPSNTGLDPKGEPTRFGDSVCLGLWDYRGDREALAEVKEEHLLLELDPFTISGPKLPNLEGISGAPVWRVHNDNSRMVRPAFVGVQTGFHRLGNGTLVIRATPATFVLELIK